MKSPTEGGLYVVHRQPIALDRFTIHDVGTKEASGLFNLSKYTDEITYVMLTLNGPLSRNHIQCEILFCFFISTHLFITVKG